MKKYLPNDNGFFVYLPLNFQKEIQNPFYVTRSPHHWH